MADTGDMIIKYRKEEYMDKISRLEGYVKKLQDLKDQLNSKNSQLTNIWSDDQGKSYQSKINRALKGCDTAIQDTNITLKGLRDTISIMEDMASDINSGMDNLQQTVDRIAAF